MTNWRTKNINTVSDRAGSRSNWLKKLWPFRAAQSPVAKVKERETIAKQTPRKPSRINKKAFAGLFVFILTAVVLIFGFKFISSEKYKVKNFEFIGNSSVTDVELESAIGEYKNKSIYTVSTSKIEKHLQNNYSFIKKINVRKVLPDKIQIIMVEKEPVMVFVTLAGAYVIDEDGKIIETISSQEFNFAQDNIDIIRGFGNPNAKYVESRYFVDNLVLTADMERELNEKFAPEYQQNKLEGISTQESYYKLIVPAEEKNKILQSLKEELLPIAQSNHDKLTTAVSSSEYSSLLTVYTYENIVYKNGDYLDSTILKNSLEITRHFAASSDIAIKQILWESKFAMKVQLSNSVTIIFGTRRNIALQIEDYTIVTNKLKADGRSYTIIDVGSEKVSVR